VTAFDQSDEDWWKGKRLGQVGYFPASYVRKVNPGETPYKVLTSVEIQHAHDGSTVRLLKDQIVVKISEPDEDQMLIIRTAEDVELPCPMKYVAEV
ncbi:hypothetical protein CAPTEDRAFT_29538, partial [Capitella teleta]